MVVFREAQALVEAAANALLKSFEEPRPGTSFVMLAPQRERLLPTLVSRSLVLTLPWPRPADDAALSDWERALCAFLRSGRDFLDRTGARGAVDAPLAHALTNLCRRALAARLKGEGGSGLSGVLRDVPEARLRILDEALAESQESLNYGVNPTLVLEWLATRLYFLVPKG
jgi:DNA polymerase-3 subunit delta'